MYLASSPLPKTGVLLIVQGGLLDYGGGEPVIAGPSSSRQPAGRLQGSEWVPPPQWFEAGGTTAMPLWQMAVQGEIELEDIPLHSLSSPWQGATKLAFSAPEASPSPVRQSYGDPLVASGNSSSSAAGFVQQIVILLAKFKWIVALLMETGPVLTRQPLIRH